MSVTVVTAPEVIANVLHVRFHCTMHSKRSNLADVVLQTNVLLPRRASMIASCSDSQCRSLPTCNLSEAKPIPSRVLLLGPVIRAHEPVLSTRRCLATPQGCAVKQVCPTRGCSKLARVLHRHKKDAYVDRSLRQCAQLRAAPDILPPTRCPIRTHPNMLCKAQRCQHLAFVIARQHRSAFIRPPALSRRGCAIRATREGRARSGIGRAHRRRACFARIAQPERRPAIDLYLSQPIRTTVAQAVARRGRAR